jgi:predicted nucleic acid-binding protein
MDTNVLVAGACRHEGSLAYRLLLLVLEERVPLILTEPIVAEYLDVLTRRPVRRLTELSERQSIELVTDLVALSYRTQLRFSWRPNLADEGDNKMVEAAIHTAAIIVTYNLADFQRGDLVQHGWTAMSPYDFLTRYELER